MPSPTINETPIQREARLRRQRAYEARRRESDSDGFRKRSADSQRRYRQRHPEKSKAAVKKWRNENRDQFNATRRKWHRENLPLMMWHAAKGRAKRTGQEFTITVDDIPPMGECCPILGHPFAEPDGSRNSLSPSLDRIDSARGYVPGNVWIIGYRANLIKNDGTAEEHEMIATAMRRMGVS